MDPLLLREALREAGRTLGFLRVGFTSAAPLPDHEFLLSWLARGMAGSMHYLLDSADHRHLPTQLLPSAKTAVVVAASYAGARVQREESDCPSASGRIARYAQGPDYHEVLRRRLYELAATLHRLTGGAQPIRVAVDTAPLLERALARRAGLGFIGKNTLLIVPGHGSYTVLGTLLISDELPPDDGSQSIVARCGECSLCLQACPTGALVAPHLLDARRCISYLTIEQRGPVATAWRDSISPWLFGCDICQQVCPHNARATERGPTDAELSTARLPARYPLEQILALRAGSYRRFVRGTALSRASRLVLMRNAALVAAKQRGRHEATLVALLEKATSHADVGLAEAARWALAQRS